MSSILSLNNTYMEDLSHEFRLKTNIIPHQQQNICHGSINARDRLDMLIRQVDDNDLRIMMQSEFKSLVIDHQRLVTMLEQRTDLLESENDELKVIIGDGQRRYEKAVREMQFFKKRYDQLQGKPPPVGHDAASVYSTANSSYWPSSPTASSSGMSEGHSSRRVRKNSNTTPSLFSSYSNGNTESTSIHSRYDEHNRKPSTSSHSYGRSQFMPSSSYPTPSVISGSSSVISVPMSTSRSCASSQSSSVILQRRIDPLTFGGSDALWDTIAKSQGNDATVEKIISNFLRRGGSPNTAKQSPSSQNVKYGYGMIHALIATRSLASLDLLLQQGANPNAVSLSQVEEDKVSPCYLAASIGWLPGLEKLVQAGGDLISARGAGLKKKTALHIAAELGHLNVVEYIVDMTQGVLNMETDFQGANAAHYACLSGYPELVAFMVQVCQIPLIDSDRRGELPLHWAIRTGRMEVVSMLIERFGCDPNAYIPKRVSTPYDMAKSSGHKKLAEYIKSKGGLTSKKMDKKREEELAPRHLESALLKNGFFMDG